MRENLLGVLGILGFFFPAEVMSSVLLVFTMENVLEAFFTAYVPDEVAAPAWLVIYVLGVGLLAGLQYVSSDEEEREELQDDLEDLT